MSFRQQFASPRTPNQIRIDVGRWRDVRSVRVSRKTDIRLGSYHTTNKVSGERQTGWSGMCCRRFAGVKVRCATPRYCKKRYLRLYRHVRHYTENNSKSLLQAKRGRCFIIAWCTWDVDRLVSHERKEEGGKGEETVWRRGLIARVIYPTT